MKYLPLMRRFIPNVVKLALEDTFINFSAGGEFRYFSVWRRNSTAVEHVCLFCDTKRINDPLSERVLEGVEDGFGLDITGLYLASDGTKVSLNSPLLIDELRVKTLSKAPISAGDEDYWLFALAASQQPELSR